MQEVRIRSPKEPGRRIRHHTLHILEQEAARASGQNSHDLVASREEVLYQHSSVAFRTRSDCVGSLNCVSVAFAIRRSGPYYASDPSSACRVPSLAFRAGGDVDNRHFVHHRRQRYDPEDFVGVHWGVFDLLMDLSWQSMGLA